MDIKLIPSSTALLIDANIFLYHLSDLSQDCTDFWDRLADGDFEAYTTTVIIAETLHRRMVSEALDKGLISPGQPIKKLKANPNVITLLTDYFKDVEDLLKLPLKVAEITQSDITASHALRQIYGLFVNDSINLARAKRLRITNVVTHDADFARVNEITVWQPDDI